MIHFKNNVQLIGQIENIFTEKVSETKLQVDFSIVTEETFFNDDHEKVKERVIHSCRATGKKAEILDKFTKDGSKIALEGRIINLLESYPLKTIVMVHDLILL